MVLKKYDLVVAGGGISGLSLAHYASKAGLKTLLIEKAPQAGGCLRTLRQPGNFWLELGAHTCYNSYANLIGIIEDRGMGDEIQGRTNAPFSMFLDGAVKSIPSQLNFAELFCSAPRIFSLDKSGMTVGSYYSKLVGKRNFEKVLGPALSAVPSQKANDFPADMLFKKRKRRKDIIKKFTLKGGLQTVADGIAGNRALEVLTGTEVKGIEYENNLFKVMVPGTGELAAEGIGLAVPPPVAGTLLGKAFPEIEAQLSGIHVTRVESTGVVVRKEDVRLPVFAGLIPVNDLFFSIVSRDIVPDKDYRGFTFHFRPGLSSEVKRKRIEGVLGIGKFEAFSENSAVLPSPVMGHDKIVGNIDRLLEGKRIFITGNYFAGLAIEDCVTRSLNEFNRLIKDK